MAMKGENYGKPRERFIKVADPGALYPLTEQCPHCGTRHLEIPTKPTDAGRCRKCEAPLLPAA